jgi:hypothetical protein
MQYSFKYQVQRAGGINEEREVRWQFVPVSFADAHRLSAFARRTFQETFAAQNTPEDMDVYLASAFNDARQLSEIEDPGTITLLAESGATLSKLQLGRLATMLAVALRPPVSEAALLRTVEEG